MSKFHVLEDEFISLVSDCSFRPCKPFWMKDRISFMKRFSENLILIFIVRVDAEGEMFSELWITMPCIPDDSLLKVVSSFCMRIANSFDFIKDFENTIEMGYFPQRSQNKLVHLLEDISSLVNAAESEFKFPSFESEYEDRLRTIIDISHSFMRNCEQTVLLMLRDAISHIQISNIKSLRSIEKIIDVNLDVVVKHCNDKQVKLIHTIKRSHLVESITEIIYIQLLCD